MSTPKKSLPPPPESVPAFSIEEDPDSAPPTPPPTVPEAAPNSPGAPKAPEYY